MEEHKLKSGAVLELQMASFEDSMALLDAILLEMVGVPVAGFDFKELGNKDVTQLKDALFKVISSKKVKDALWVCMGSCLYRPKSAAEGTGVRVTPETFQPPASRADFFPVAGEVTTYNLSPFFANLELPSSIREGMGALAGAPKSETS